MADHLFKDHLSLRNLIQEKIWDPSLLNGLANLSEHQLRNASVVLFVLSLCPRDDGQGPLEPCLILNKRSSQVRQGGDLCCPGGGLDWTTDRLLSRLLYLPLSPLKRWRYWRPWRAGHHNAQAVLGLMLAAGIREAWEEMGLNPLRLTFLGMLPEQQLVMFKRVIYPMVGWACAHRFKPNWEVERIVPIALSALLDISHYGRFRLMVAPHDEGQARSLGQNDFPCFIHEDHQGRELLWGATFRLVQDFLRLVFDFSLPATAQLPLVHHAIGETYLDGSRQRPL